MSSRTVFSLENVGYQYPDGVAALTEISLEIRAGDCVAFIGANGCGKSTLLKLLNALIFPSEGTISAFGRVLSPHALANQEFALMFRRSVGLVFQDPDVQLFCSTVEEEISFGLLQLGFPKDEAADRVEKTINDLRIAHIRHRPPYRLSGGEKRKVALASVLCLEPEVLLLDEPTVGLDARSQGELIDLVWKLRDEGKTIVTATHDLSIIRELASFVYVIGENHRLVFEGTTREVLENQNLLQEANLLHVHSHQHGGQIHKHFHIHQPPHPETSGREHHEP
ncbi:MAG: energy-coupling factor ABC transporter ATP-binding protein [Armatimonadota bacterium]